MNVFDEILTKANNETLDFLKEKLAEATNPIKVMVKNFETLKKECKAAEKNKSLTVDFSKYYDLDNGPVKFEPVRRESIKENVEPANEEPRQTRTRRNAAKDASINMSKQLNQSLNKKLRQHTNENQMATIKIEKIPVETNNNVTFCVSSKSTDSPQPNTDLVNIKSEPEMPPPQIPAPRTCTRKPRTRRNAKNTDSIDTDTSTTDNDDIVIVEPKMSTVIVKDEWSLSPLARSTRTRTRAKAAALQATKNSIVAESATTPSTATAATTSTNNKRSRRDQSDDGKDKGKRSKSDSGAEESTNQISASTTIIIKTERISTNINELESVKSLLEFTSSVTLLSKDTAELEEAAGVNDRTYIASEPIPDDNMAVDENNGAGGKEKSNLNCTVVLQKPTIEMAQYHVSEEMFTDEESEAEEEVKKTETSSKKEAKKPGNNTKQVFNVYKTSPVKKRVETFEKLTQFSKKPRLPIKVDKFATPGTNSFKPLVCSSGKTLRTIPSSASSKGNTPAGNSLKQRPDQEQQGSIKKCNSTLKAQGEEKRNINEEKHLKAQQKREEAINREKQKQLEQLKSKDERHKLLLAKQEADKQKIREEAEKKRLMAKTKAMEEKKCAKTSVDEAKSPVYMSEPLPYLPTFDCYDSDDERCPTSSEKELKSPSWAKGSALEKKQLAQLSVGEKMKNTFFCLQPDTPDLAEIFLFKSRRHCRRDSSAIWDTKPKYSILPTVFDGDEEDS